MSSFLSVYMLLSSALVQLTNGNESCAFYPNTNSVQVQRPTKPQDV